MLIARSPSAFQTDQKSDVAMEILIAAEGELVRSRGPACMADHPSRVLAFSGDIGSRRRLRCELRFAKEIGLQRVKALSDGSVSKQAPQVRAVWCFRWGAHRRI